MNNEPENLELQVLERTDFAVFGSIRGLDNPVAVFGATYLERLRERCKDARRLGITAHPEVRDAILKLCDELLPLLELHTTVGNKFGRGPAAEVAAAERQIEQFMKQFPKGR